MPAAETPPSLANVIGRLRAKHLALIVAIAETKSLHKAAETIAVSQPAATNMLHEIEDMLGVPLFERHPRGMLATAYGALAMLHARRILVDVGNLRDQLARVHAGSEGKVAVGAVMAPAPSLLTRTIAALKQRHPKLAISVRVETSDVLVPELAEGKLDVVLGRLTPVWENAGLDFEVLDDEPLCVVAGSRHPLARERHIHLRDLADLQWILQPRGSPMREVLELEFVATGMRTPINVVETASILTTTLLLSETDMIAVVPTSVARHYAVHEMLCVLPVTLTKKLPPYGIVTRSNQMRPPAAQLFLDALRRTALTPSV